MKKEQELFEVLQQILDGDCEKTLGSFHILDMSPDIADEVFLRVYHSEGYCFDSNLEWTDSDDMEHTFFSQFDGFKELSIDRALELAYGYKLLNGMK